MKGTVFIWRKKLELIVLKSAYLHTELYSNFYLNLNCVKCSITLAPIQFFNGEYNSLTKVATSSSINKVIRPVLNFFF